MAKTTVHQNPITLIIPITPGNVDQLRSALKIVKQDLAEGRKFYFSNIPTIHYARWIIIDDKDEIGNPDHEDAKLIFSSNFDGSIEDQLRDLCTISADITDHIYQYCSGYPEKHLRTPENRMNYLRQWNVPASSFYRGSPNRSLEQIRNESKLRNHLRKILDEHNFESTSAKSIHKKLKEEIKSIPEFRWALKPFKMPGINWIGMFFTGIFLLIFSPFIILMVLIIQFFYERKDSYFTLKRNELDEARIRELELDEDFEFQNQFTQLVSLKAGRMRLFAFRFMMLFSKVLIKFLFVKGKLMGIPSIHFARWVLFDDNKRVLFCSNFDGSWQQYLGDFIDKSGWGLTGIFSNTTNFPKTRFMFFGGAYDEEHFLAWSRNTEIPTQVWYNAYPELSIKNVNNNSLIRSLLFKNLSEKKAANFLKLI